MVQVTPRELWRPGDKGPVRASELVGNEATEFLFHHRGPNLFGERRLWVKVCGHWNIRNHLQI